MKRALVVLLCLLASPAMAWFINPPPSFQQPGITGPKGDKGAKGDKGDPGPAGMAGRDGRDAGTKTKVGGEVVIRFYDSQLVQAESYYSYDLRGMKPDFIGGRLVFKVGKSYEEKLIEKLRKELKR